MDPRSNSDGLFGLKVCVADRREKRERRRGREEAQRDCPGLPTCQARVPAPLPVAASRITDRTASRR